MSLSTEAPPKLLLTFVSSRKGTKFMIDDL
jgi:hypothetical protein